MRYGRSKTKSYWRAGAAVVEFALILPIIMLMLAAILEFSRVLMLKQTVNSAAYEGARAAVVVGSTPQTVHDSVDELMSSTLLKKWVTEIEPAVFDEQTSAITVRVTLPIADNSWITPFFSRTTFVTSTVTLITERPPAVQLAGIPKLKANANNLPAAGSVPLPGNPAYPPQ